MKTALPSIITSTFTALAITSIFAAAPAQSAEHLKLAQAARIEHDSLMLQFARGLNIELPNYSVPKASADSARLMRRAQQRVSNHSYKGIELAHDDTADHRNKKGHAKHRRVHS